MLGGTNHAKKNISWETRWLDETIRNGLRDARRDQRLAPAERHTAVADPVDLYAAEAVAAPELFADRPDHADPAADCVAAAAGGRDVHRSPADAVLAGVRHGVLADRPAAVGGGAHTRPDPVRRGADGDRVVDLPSGVVAHRANVVRRAARPRPVGVPGRRQHGVIARAAARGVLRRAARSVEPGVVR